MPKLLPNDITKTFTKSKLKTSLFKLSKVNPCMLKVSENQQPTVVCPYNLRSKTCGLLRSITHKSKQYNIGPTKKTRSLMPRRRALGTLRSNKFYNYTFNTPRPRPRRVSAKSHINVRDETIIYIPYSNHFVHSAKSISRDNTIASKHDANANKSGAVISTNCLLKDSTTSKKSTKICTAKIVGTKRLVDAAIRHGMKSTKGVASFYAMKKFMEEHYGQNVLDIEQRKPKIREYLRKAVEKGHIIRVSGRGLNGSFRLFKKPRFPRKAIMPKGWNPANEEETTKTIANTKRDHNLFKAKKSSTKTKTKVIFKRNTKILTANTLGYKKSCQKEQQV